MAAKFKKGEAISDVLELVRLLVDGRYVYEWDKPQHPSWMMSRQLSDLKLSMQRGAFSRAESNEPITEPTT